MRERDRAFRQGFHFAMGAISALVIAWCVVILILILITAPW
jgi:hypothetical protein